MATVRRHDLHALDPALGGGDHVVRADVGHHAGHGDQDDKDEAHHNGGTMTLRHPHWKSFIGKSQSPMESIPPATKMRHKDVHEKM